MKYYTIEKQNIVDLIDSLQKKYRVVAPKAKENQFIIDDIDSPDEIKLLHRPPILSLKKFYLPQEENLISFNLGEKKVEPVHAVAEQILVFGAHTCDIAGIACLDNACGEEPMDRKFFKRKKKILIVGIECNDPCDEYATCITVGTHIPRGGYDLMLTDIGNTYLMQVNSEDGENILSNSKYIKQTYYFTVDYVNKMRMDKDKKFPRKINVFGGQIKSTLEKTEKSEVWDDVGRRCVSCGNCTNVCPTCYCFDIKDDVDLKLTEGRRYRTWDSCQLSPFATVAGGENFRKERKDRQKHRYLRKFVYCVDKFNRYFCVGCGRCTRTCMAKISLIETINSLAKETIWM